MDLDQIIVLRRKISDIDPDPIKLVFDVVKSATSAGSEYETFGVLTVRAFCFHACKNSETSFLGVAFFLLDFFLGGSIISLICSIFVTVSPKESP